MTSLQLCDMRGGFLYQHRPDLFPQGFLTKDELILWVMYYESKQEKDLSRGTSRSSH